jgi:ATP-dependent helicase/nuclease subunit B
VVRRAGGRRARARRIGAGARGVPAAGGGARRARSRRVADAGAALDPLAHPDREISPSSLETLAKCPLSWFYRYGLGVREPADPVYDEEQWLDAMQRGALLHELYERVTRQYMERQGDLLLADAERFVASETDALLARWRELVPPPSEIVFAGEAEAIRVDARRFLELEREHQRHDDGARWTAVELPFGRQMDGTEATSGTYALGDATIRVHGRADRVDTLPDGTLRVIDYKTGSAARFTRDPKKAPFAGGRQLQPAIYASAVTSVLGAEVSSFEYRFPTERGRNETVTYTRAELDAAAPIVRELIAGVARGEFLPSDDAGDCAWCEYAGICRVRLDDRGGADSPRAAWAAEHGRLSSLYAPMLQRRSIAVAVAGAAEEA